MRKKILFVAIPAILTVTIILALFPEFSHSPEKELIEVLENLNHIESATYYSYRSGHAPGDTSAQNIYISYVKEYSNPADTFVGARFVNLMHDDTTKMTYSYDGIMRARMNWNKNKFETDDFRNNPWPFRVVIAPFFTMAKSILEYALETDDSIRIETEYFGDSTRYSFLIYNDIIEIIGNRIIHDTLYKSGIGEISRYDIWINKPELLPFRIKRKMPHDISEISIKKVKINKNYPDVFLATDYFPPDSILQGEKKPVKPKIELLEREAPSWVLKDEKGNSVALHDFKSKVVMIQFSSVSCGPCRQSIEFLNDLQNEYDRSEFDFVSIESYSRTPAVIKRYRQRNDLNYIFLISTDEVTASYQIEAVPVFYFLDESRVIRKKIMGYAKAKTDMQIRKTIDSLLQGNHK